LPADVKENTFTIPDNEYFLITDNQLLITSFSLPLCLFASLPFLN